MTGRLAAVFALVPAVVAAAPPEIMNVRAVRSGDTWRFDVTVLHPDTGWDHYADGWEVLDAEGRRLGFRELVHPHETEQPFTRSLTGVAVPPDLTEVHIRPRCSVDGWAEGRFAVPLPLD